MAAALAAAGIGTAIHYPVPIHLQPAAAGLGHGPGAFPETERQAAPTLSLPVHQGLGEAEIDRVAAEIRRFYAAA